MVTYNRILIVDDTYEIHEDFRKILRSPRLTMRNQELKKLEMELFEDTEFQVKAELTDIEYRIDSAYQGNQAIDMVTSAYAGKDPYAVVFMDVRMPPGLTGVETIERIWKEFPCTEIVIVTAYSDYSWEQILERVGITDHLMFLRKPFDQVSVKQMALALTRKFNVTMKVRKFLDNVEGELASRNTQLSKMLAELKNI